MIETDYITKNTISNFNKESFRFQPSLNKHQFVDFDSFEGEELHQQTSELQNTKKLDTIAQDISKTTATNNNNNYNYTIESNSDDLNSENSYDGLSSTNQPPNNNGDQLTQFQQSDFYNNNLGVNLSSNSTSNSSINSSEAVINRGIAPDNNTGLESQQNDLNLSEFLNRAKGNWKKIKEISKKEDKRPPWQMVSLSTLPKPDKETLMKAKLLDASRRMRKNGVASQTDFVPTIIMKDAAIDIQTDLIETRDVEVLTDGRIIFRHDRPGQFILTMTTMLQTDEIPVENVNTQTPTLRNLGLNFDEFYNQIQFKDNENDNETNQNIKVYNFKRNYKKIENQLKEIQKTSEQLLKFNNSLKDIPKLKERKMIKELNEEQLNRIESSDEMQLKFHKLSQSLTYSYWSFSIFDHLYLNGNETKKERIPIKNSRYPLRTSKLLQQFKTDASTKFSTPTIQSIQSTTAAAASGSAASTDNPQKLMLWNDLQRNAILQLLQESIGLNKLFEEVALKIGPTIKKDTIKPKKFPMPEFASDKWLPQIQMAEKQIRMIKMNVRKRNSKQYGNEAVVQLTDDDDGYDVEGERAEVIETTEEQQELESKSSDSDYNNGNDSYNEDGGDAGSEDSGDTDIPNNNQEDDIEDLANNDDDIDYNDENISNNSGSES